MKRKTILSFGLFFGLVIFGMCFTNLTNKTISQSNLGFKSSNNYFMNDLITHSRPNSSELIDFADTLIIDQLTRFSIPGATISIVMDDEIVLAKGYGRSDYFPPKFVDNQTLFRIGSVSKTFTAIATMQLVEDGLLDLNTDINEYLTAFQIPDTFSEPITLKHLLTHTPGFEEFPAFVIYGSAVPLSLEEILMTFMPDRVNPPGLITSYSNYGLGLIGYLIEELSGKSFEQYVEDEILHPLGMNCTSFRQPLPAPLALNMSTGYYEDTTEQYFEYVTLPSAGSCSSTSSDMAILMMTLLNNGTYNGTEILQESSVAMMFDDQFLPHEELSGVGFGLYEFYPNNVKAWGHGGDTSFFHSNMVLFPEENMGFFISYNSYNGAYAKSEFLGVFIETFYPYSSQPPIPMEGYNKGLNQYAGYYVTSRRYYTDQDIKSYTSDMIIYSFEITDWFDEMQEIEVKNRRIFYGSIELVQVEPDYFVEITGVYDIELAFIRDEDGRVSYLYANFMTSLITLEKINPFYFESGGVFAALIIVGFTYFLSLLWWIVEAIIDSRKKKEKALLIPSLSKGLVAGVLVLNAILIGVVYPMSQYQILLETNTLSDIGGLLAIPIVVIILITGMIILSVLSWIGFGKTDGKPYGKLWERIHYLVLIVLSAIFIFAFGYWHFLG